MAIGLGSWSPFTSYSVNHSTGEVFDSSNNTNLGIGSTGSGLEGLNNFAPPTYTEDPYYAENVTSQVNNFPASGYYNTPVQEHNPTLSLWDSINADSNSWAGGEGWDSGEFGISSGGSGGNVYGGQGGGGPAIVHNNQSSKPTLITRKPSGYTYNPITVGNPNYVAPTPTPTPYSYNDYSYGRGLSNAGADYGSWGTPYNYGGPQSTSSSAVSGPADNAINQPAINVSGGNIEKIAGGMIPRPGGIADAERTNRFIQSLVQGQRDDGWAGEGMLTPAQREYQRKYQTYMDNNPDAGLFDFDKEHGILSGDKWGEWWDNSGVKDNLNLLDFTPMATLNKVKQGIENLLNYTPPPPPPDWYPDIHPVTKLPTKPTEGETSWTQPETGLTFHNEGYNWNNKSPGQVEPLVPEYTPSFEGEVEAILGRDVAKDDDGNFIKDDDGNFIKKTPETREQQKERIKKEIAENYRRIDKIAEERVEKRIAEKKQSDDGWAGEGVLTPAQDKALDKEFSDFERELEQEFSSIFSDDNIWI